MKIYIFEKILQRVILDVLAIICKLLNLKHLHKIEAQA